MSPCTGGTRSFCPIQSLSSTRVITASVICCYPKYNQHTLAKTVVLKDLAGAEPGDAETFQWINLMRGDTMLMSLSNHRYLATKPNNSPGPVTATATGPTPAPGAAAVRPQTRRLPCGRAARHSSAVLRRLPIACYCYADAPSGLSAWRLAE